MTSCVVLQMGHIGQLSPHTRGVPDGKFSCLCVVSVQCVGHLLDMWMLSLRHCVHDFFVSARLIFMRSLQGIALRLGGRFGRGFMHTVKQPIKMLSNHKQPVICQG